jgi:hypothetical protein
LNEFVSKKKKHLNEKQGKKFVWHRERKAYIVNDKIRHPSSLRNEGEKEQKEISLRIPLSHIRNNENQYP